MSESLRDLLQRGADTVERPRLDVSAWSRSGAQAGPPTARHGRGEHGRRRLDRGRGASRSGPTTERPAPPPVSPVETPDKTPDQADTGPSAREWVSDLKTDGSVLYVTTADCAGKVQDGYCTTRGVFADDAQLDQWGYWSWPGKGSLRLWRYAAGRWDRLTSPGVTYGEFWAVPAGLVLKVWPSRGRPLPRVSIDGGELWETWQPPRGRRSCKLGDGQHDQRECDVAVVGDAVIVTNGPLWMRRPLSGGPWQDVSPPSRELLGTVTTAATASSRWTTGRSSPR